MNNRLMFGGLLLALVVSPQLMAQVLYNENFEVDATSDWLLNPGANGTDVSADFFFDYSSVGIPTAPNSGDSSTRGMKIQANLFSGIFGGGSVSPLNQSFEGDYVLKFDFWSNYAGDPGNPLVPGEGVATGGIGQTNLSFFGIESDGITGIEPGGGDGIWFGATGDGGSGADFRAYSIERNVSYQFPPDPESVEDTHATYHAGSRNGSAELYEMNFGGVAPPAEQTAIFPQQTGVTPLGAVAFEWHEVEIKKEGTLVTWTMNDALLISVETAEFTTPTRGNNIFFGHTDINTGSGEDASFDLLFTLIDNIEVSELGASLVVGDMNGDGSVNFGDLGGFVSALTNPAQYEADFPDLDRVGLCDASGDGECNFGDLGGFVALLTGGGAAASSAAVPEPTSLAMLVCGLACLGWRRRNA